MLPLLTASAVLAQENQYIINQNQTGLTLPGVAMPNGFDEVRAADGTTCRSSMAGSGAYLDSGVIGGGLNGSSNSVSAYGRLVMPLGEKPPRLNCDRLYQLELRRLELEVRLLQQGLDPRATTIGVDARTASEGWTNEGRK
ncbi:hypothetical protein [Nitratireductor pacificus]|uniref:Uncharacterized protein n=1 Tax=Nitratireductor pacificus pht-3B TaxID=391937 RepID=K2MJQ6_9HYPH|nr:hypothetical protein [Nitratireductor pacificus]EKF20950.1 hypothetical protein NA2_01190 [Nitratireductor pacificus pht-3B]